MFPAHSLWLALTLSNELLTATIYKLLGPKTNAFSRWAWAIQRHPSDWFVSVSRTMTGNLQTERLAFHFTATQPQGTGQLSHHPKPSSWFPLFCTSTKQQTFYDQFRNSYRSLSLKPLFYLCPNLHFKLFCKATFKVLFKKDEKAHQMRNDNYILLCAVDEYARRYRVLNQTIGPSKTILPDQTG